MKKFTFILTLILVSLIAINAQTVTKSNILGKWHFAKMIVENQMTIDVENGKFVKGEMLRELISKNPQMEKMIVPAIATMIKELRSSSIEFLNNGKIKSIAKGKSQTVTYVFDEKAQTISFKSGGVGSLENANISFISADRLQIRQGTVVKGKTVNTTIILKKE